MDYYGNWHSGHSYKVALYANLMGIEYNYQHIDTFAPPENWPVEFHRDSRYQEVPVIILEGRAISQSNCILTVLSKKYGHHALSHHKDVIIQEWLFWEMSRLSVGVAHLRFHTKYGGVADELMAFFNAKAVNALDQLNDALSDSRYLCGSELTIADVSCCAYLFLLDETGLNVNDWPAVARWLVDISGLPGWKHPYDIVPKE